MSEENTSHGSKTNFQEGASGDVDAVVKSEEKASPSLEKCDTPEHESCSDLISSFEKLEVESITEDHLAEIMGDIRTYHYSPATRGDERGYYGSCYGLFLKDYNVVRVDNIGGELCYNYPPCLIIPAGRKDSGWYANSKTESEFQKQYLELVKESNVVRSRSRFVAPVIFFDNKFICRSGTVGNVTTAMYETIAKQPGFEYQIVEESTTGYIWRKIGGVTASSLQKSVEVSQMAINPETMRHRLSKDVELLSFLKVEHICDLMVETEKLVLLNLLTVSSSEKVNLDLYQEFKIEQMPFPGCEFFKQYHNANRNPEKLVFNWATPDVNVEFKLSEDVKESFPHIEWDKIKEWDLIELTKAYMEVLLTYIARDSGSLLVHCISGWDRTPLFICLLRVSLWADGLIHESLNAIEMAFLTLAYDWYLFGHAFPVRYSKHEEVMHFCFNIMQHMASDEFSVTRIFHKLPLKQKENRKFPEFKPGVRREKMEDIGSRLLRMYDQEIINAPTVEVSEYMVKSAFETIWNLFFPRENVEA